MAILLNKFKLKFAELIPLLLLLFISLNGSSVIDFNFFSISMHYILVYFWVLKKPHVLGFGFIFLSGIITDVIFDLPVGVTPLTLLVIASAASYVRAITVRATLIYDWFSFMLVLLIANFVYYIVLNISSYSIDYLYLFKNSISTFIFYPILWLFFTMLSNLMKS